MVLFYNFVQVMEKYAVFEGRASRSEFWWYALALLIIAFLLGSALLLLSFVPYALTVGIYIFILAILSPTLAVTVRRLHDTGRSAWWLLGFVPSVVHALVAFAVPPSFSDLILPVGIVGRILEIVLTIFMVLPSNSGDNRYGADPR